MRHLLLIMMMSAPLAMPLASLAADKAEEKPAKAYRWKAEDGSIVFSTTPPPAGVEAESVELRDPDVVIEQDRRQLQQMINRSRAMDRQINMRVEQREELRRQLAEAEEELGKAQQALAEGDEPMPGERQRVASGGTKLSPAYFERQARLKSDVEKIQQRVEALNDELAKLR